MEFWNNIINTALLGTDKKQISNSELNEELVEINDQIQQENSLDKEEKYLQIASVAFNYRQCGILPLFKEEIINKKAAQEEYPYCSEISLRALKDILDEQSISLLKFWLKHCSDRQQMVTPEIIPALFEIAVAQKKLRPLIIKCCGKRGEWLSDFNPEWSFYFQESDGEIWQNGNTEQRKKILRQLRESDPGKAREWLADTWAAENANIKAELLKQLEVNISENDKEWLENLQEEKSQKLKEALFGLLKKIPNSGVVLNYWNILQKSIILKKEKTLLGMLSKTSLQIQLIGINESIFKTGIEKLSNTKEFSDDEFIIYQLIEFIPPQNWEEHFNSAPEQVIGYFQKEKSAQKYLPGLAKAVLHFKNIKWATVFLENDLFYSELIRLFPEKQQDKYSVKFFEKESDNILRIAKEREEEWSAELTRIIFNHTAKNIYQYNRGFYSENIQLIPASIQNNLVNYSPSEEYAQSTWSNMSEYISKLLKLKLETTHAFQ